MLNSVYHVVQATQEKNRRNQRKYRERQKVSVEILWVCCQSENTWNLC